MFKYKTTEEFDIGAGLGEYEYDFFTINDEDDFWALINHYTAVYRRFDYFFDFYETVENNNRLSPVVQAKMKEHSANLCLTLLEKKFGEKSVGIRYMVVNEQKSNETYETYLFYFTTVSARYYLGCENPYEISGLHGAAMRHYFRAIKLAPYRRFAFIYSGISYLNRKNYDKAIEDFTQAINLNTDHSELFGLRGLAYKEAGDFDKARADFAKALELDPSDEMAKECFEEISKA